MTSNHGSSGERRDDSAQEEAEDALEYEPELQLIRCRGRKRCENQSREAASDLGDKHEEHCVRQDFQGNRPDRSVVAVAALQAPIARHEHLKQGVIAIVGLVYKVLPSHAVIYRLQDRRKQESQDVQRVQPRNPQHEEAPGPDTTASDRRGILPEEYIPADDPEDLNAVYAEFKNSWSGRYNGCKDRIKSTGASPTYQKCW
jgi:hypothetical protein